MRTLYYIAVEPAVYYMEYYNQSSVYPTRSYILKNNHGRPYKHGLTTHGANSFTKIYQFAEISRK